MSITFENYGEGWWDEDGLAAPLHAITPLRMAFIDKNINVAGKKIADIGCGGGILSEALSKRGAQVTGLDTSASSIEIAQKHARQNNLSIDYQNQDLANFAQDHKQSFDMVCCLEVLEHVDNPEGFVSNCLRLLKPEGVAFFSTLNKTPQAFFKAIVAAEYILQLLPRKTHDYARFIKPSTLQNWLDNCGFQIADMSGISYAPISKRYYLTADVQVNYLLMAHKKNL